MSALSGNGNNGSRPTLLARMFGFLGRPVSRNGSSTHVMTSDGAASVDVEKLIKSQGFKESAVALKEYFKDTPTP